MNENELKDKLNVLRNEVERHKRQINEVLSEVKVHQKDIMVLRNTRDQKNDECKRLSQEAKKYRESRDELNAKIAQLKEERRGINDRIKSMSGAIKESKEKRDLLNRSARGSDASLVSRYERDMEALMTRDIPLDKEIKIFESIFSLMDRVEAAKEATNFHQKVISTYDEIKGHDDRADKLSAEIRALADESEKFHLQAVEVYAKVDALRKEADDAHALLLEKYNVVNPLRDKITAIKKDMDKVQEDMSPYSDEMDKIRAVKEGERKAQLAVEAKQKLKTSKRISFEDFKAIIEGDASKDLSSEETMTEAPVASESPDN
jgi:uncharacterized coiled-coil DUF342 family protein